MFIMPILMSDIPDNDDILAMIDKLEDKGS